MARGEPIRSPPPSIGPSGEPSRADLLVRTFNSAATLERCLQSARATIPIHRLIVVDRCSTDATEAIARRFGAVVRSEDVGIGRATRLALMEATTDLVVFLDSDVEIVRSDFYAQAVARLARPGVGAVVGGSVGHRFVYGLPLGLTVVPRAWALGVPIPDDAQGAETYFLRRALRRARLRVAYVPDAMVHFGTYRGRHWPEWQGAQLRLAAGWSASELANAFFVTVMIGLNRGTVAGAAYVPIFYLKLLRGFLAPSRWRWRDRRLHPD